ncbi:MAG: hypothetical protein GY772_26915 [bacterium]|nr:hypothetical protein [bacterium]
MLERALNIIPTWGPAVRALLATPTNCTRKVSPPAMFTIYRLGQALRALT